MPYKLTNNNIRLRYLAAKWQASIWRMDGSNVDGFSYKAMGKLFMVTPQACYEWTKKKLPTGPRRMAVYEWINDGRIDHYLESRDEDSDAT